MSTDMVINDTKILECDMVSPESEVFCGKEWMTDLEKAQEDEILTSTKQILEKNAQLNEEEQEAYNQAFIQKPGTLAGKEIKRINEWTLKTWSNKQRRTWTRKTYTFACSQAQKRKKKTCRKPTASSPQETMYTS